MVGSVILTFALIAGITSTVMYFLSYKGNNNALNIARISYHAMTIFVIAASALLMYAILNHQYYYKYIYNYSGTDLPFGLKMTTFYAGQEGSFMLWTLFTAITGVFLQQYTTKREDLEPRVMAVFTLAMSFLLLMVSPLLKNPFAYIWSVDDYIAVQNINASLLNLPFMQNFLFSDNSTGQTYVKIGADLKAAFESNGYSITSLIVQGKGLNPLLQNFWMQIHPPILFVGFALATVPFAFAAAALMKNEYKNWIKQSFPWVIATTAILGLAIMLGGYWAYGVLGWGGYWGWDPVENSSLVPWLVAVALVHTMLIQLKSMKKNQSSTINLSKNEDSNRIGEFGKTNLVLALLTYILVLYSTFLTRSGILGDASVHSFTDPGATVYLFLVIFIMTFILLGLGLMIFRWKHLSQPVEDYKNLLNRELALFTGAVAILASAIIIIAGTSAPIFGQAVQIEFYSSLNLPIGIIIGLLNGLSLLFKWKETKGQDVIKKSLFSVGAAAVLTVLIIFAADISDFMMIVLAFSASFALFVNAEIAYKIIKGNKMMLGAYVAHIGIALFLLGVVGTAGFTAQQSIDLPKDEPKEAFGYTMTFKGYTPFDNGKKYAFNIEVKKGNSVSQVAPVMFFSEYNNGLMREPDYMSELRHDLYISPLGYEDGGAEAHNHGNEVMLGKGESTSFEGAKITFASFDFPKDAMNSMMAGQDFQLGAKLQVEFNGKINEVETLLRNEKGETKRIPAEITDANLKIEMSNLDASGKVNLLLSKLNGAQVEQPASVKEVLSVEASVKPLINLVWLGVFVTCLGFLVAGIRRMKDSYFA